MKSFVICSSEFLPPAQIRNPDSIYFLYDTLDVYNGRTQYYGLYCIVAELPDGSDPDNMPVKNMMYIKMNGDVWMINNDLPEMIAQIVDPEQTIYLVKAGTSFLLRSGYRYIDHQTKVLSLPYKNGSFQLSVMVDKPIKIDNQTILVYNEETGKFEIDGERYYDEFGRNPEILKYTARETNTVKTFIQNDHIHADVKISQKAGNIIHVRTDGLYANTEEFVSVAEFQELVRRTQAEVVSFNHYLEQLQEAMAHVDITLTDQTLRDMIIELIEEYEPNIREAIEDYDAVVQRFTNTEAEVVEYIASNIDELKEDMISRIEDIPTSWGYFTDDFETTITKVSENLYKLTVPFEPDTNHRLYYKLGNEKVYLVTGQDLSTEGFTHFNNNDEISAYRHDIVSIAYCYTVGGVQTVESCSYCEAE